MELSLSISPSLSQRQSLSLDLLVGGLTGAQSVFPAVEAWLQVDGDRWNALLYVAGRKDASRYRSVLDFLLCEVVVEERAACERFYRGDGGPLREIRSARVIACYESKILLMLEVCYAAFLERRRTSWATAVAIVNELAA